MAEQRSGRDDGQQLGVSGLAGRYAIALFELALDSARLDQIAADLDRVAAMIEDSADLRRMIRSPVIRREDQARALAAIGQAAGLERLTRNFLGLLARNRRLFTLPAAIAAFRRLRAAKRGEIAAEVISAAPLDETQTAAIAAALRQAFGRDVTLHVGVDAALLGGLVVKIGSRMIDNSIRAKLQSLKYAMKGVG